MTNLKDPANAPAQATAEAAATSAGEPALGLGKVSTGVVVTAEGAALRRVGVKPALPSISDSYTELPEPVRAPEAERKDPYIGYVIDERYKVSSILGEGGMGVVYECKHSVIGKRVAMKVLRLDLARDQEVVTRFLNEARAASAIGNPHIIDISDFGQLPDGSTYFIMELLEGEPLTQVIETCQPVPVARILHIAKQLAEGLAAAHDAGIVHRDLKPDNIFLVARGTEKDFVKILDFGIAKVSTADGGRLTRVGTVFGTPHYMSPEQAAGTAVDQRGDIYSFGVILYEIASGRLPFDAENFIGILTQHMYKAPVPLRALSPTTQDISPGLEAIVLKCLSKRPEHRYQSMRELVQEIEKVENGLVPNAVAELMTRSGGFNVPSDYFQSGALTANLDSSKSGNRARWPLIAGIGGGLIALGIIVAIFVQRSPGQSQPNTIQRMSPEPSEAPIAPSADAKREEAHTARQVVLATQPLDAHGFIGGLDVGPSPILVDIPDSTTKVIEIRRAGFANKTITLDGTEGRLSIVLEKKQSRSDSARPMGASKGTKPKQTRSSSPLGGGELSDPWAH